MNQVIVIVFARLPPNDCLKLLLDFAKVVLRRYQSDGLQLEWDTHRIHQSLIGLRQALRLGHVCRLLITFPRWPGRMPQDKSVAAQLAQDSKRLRLSWLLCPYLLLSTTWLD